MNVFTYEEFVTRNIGFVSEAEQRKLRESRVCVIGVGGMGGAALQSLARTGIGSFAIADIDRFEISNLNRQVFADLDSVNQSKAEATAARLRRINPEIELVVAGADWMAHFDQWLRQYPVVINGMDDIGAGIELYRRARQWGATVIDAYTSPLPSVIVVRPEDPRPEERLRYPTAGREAIGLDDEARVACFMREIEHVLVHSSTLEHIDVNVALELVAGRRKRMSFAPMVITTGNLMAFEAVKLLLGRKPIADCRGYFFNPWTMRVERPRGWAPATLRRLVVRRFLAKMSLA